MFLRINKEDILGQFDAFLPRRCNVQAFQRAKINKRGRRGGAGLGCLGGVAGVFEAISRGAGEVQVGRGTVQYGPC